MSRHAVDVVLEYHERTKHHPGRHARSMGFMDWDCQPDPFRLYDGAPAVDLDRDPAPTAERLDDLVDPDRVDSAPVNRASLSSLLIDSLGLSAWKSSGGARWPLRCNPSSGNLHPTEAYLLLPATDGIGDAPALWHYSPLHHRLERRRVMTGSQWEALTRDLSPGGVLLGLSSIHWRESWKYGERAFRYCQHDVGHALGAVSYAAAALGWHAALLDGVPPGELSVLLGIDRQEGPEAEHPDCLVLLASSRSPRPRELNAWRPDPGIIDALQRAETSGQPGILSPRHHPWPVIDAASRGCHDAEPPAGDGWRTSPSPPRPAEAPPRDIDARQIFRQRRSAVDMDGRTVMAAPAFARMLNRTLPGVPCAPPLSSLPWRSLVHLVLFVHRVEGLDPGLYLLPRDPDGGRALAAALDSDLEQVPQAHDALADLPLSRLSRGDQRAAARDLCCHQDIASGGAFTVAMLAEYESIIRRHGAGAYRRMFWEAGAIGQVLYIEAEAAGLRGCGIGCFYDDGIHELLGLSDRRFQALYCFTVGGPVEDPRLRSLPGYPAAPRGSGAC